MPINGPVRRQLTDEVAARLRWKIMTGDLPPGEFIRIEDTAAEFGCSATPVREALSALRSEGLVRSYAHRGFAVEALSRRDIVDIFWMQAELSARIVMRIPENPSLTAELGPLTEIIDRLEAAVEARDSDTVGRTEYEFHRAVYRLAASPKAVWLLASVARYSPFELYSEDPDWGPRAVASHRRLIDLLRSDDKPAIHSEIKAAFGDARDRLIRRLESTGFWRD